jgi:type IV pilus assembly protein PilM
VVQLGMDENRVKLEAYGLLETYGKIELLQSTLQTSSIHLLGGQVVDLLKDLIDKSKITTKDVILSVPVFSTFSAVMELPDMPYTEIETSIPYEARQYIPVPVSEVVLGWNIIGKKNKASVEGEEPIKKIEVLLVAVPKEVANKYAEIAQAVNLNLKAIELESFALSRSLVGDDLTPTIIVDIGSKVTNILVVDNGYVMLNKGLDTSGNEITRALVHALNINYKRAEIMKRERGLNTKGEGDSSVDQVILPVIGIIANEISRVSSLYFYKSNKKVERVILCGGSARLPGLAEYLSGNLHLPVSIGDPWGRIDYSPSNLGPALKELAPSFSIAVGLAMREL